MDNHLFFAFALTALAGLSTGIGSALAIFTRRVSKEFLALSLGFSAGVMIYVSFVELFVTASEHLSKALGDGLGGWITAAGFFAGIVGTALIDFVVPSVENPHEMALVEDMGGDAPDHRLHRAGVLTAAAIAIHNFPEGLATMFAAQSDALVGVSIAVAIALHNIPEGISVAVPVYYATGSRKKAFWLSFWSGVAEPVGAVVGYLLLRPFLDDAVIGFTLAAVAGVMVFISLDQLIPNAKRYGREHQSVYGLIGGMALMALSLLLL